MPSATHENFVLLFRSHPELSFALARRAGVPLADGYERVDEADREFQNPLTGHTVRTDLAFVGQQHGKARHGLAIEVQLGLDLAKQWSTVLYRAGLRQQHGCPAWTLWFSPEPKVRASVHERMFLEEAELRPQVVTPEMIPIPRDLDEAIANYPWAVLAACMHAAGPDAVHCATLAIQALLCVAPKDYGKYLQLVSANVGEEVMQRVREQLPEDDQEELSEWERRGSMFTRGRAEGFSEGLEQGLRAALRTVLEVRGLVVDDRTHERIAACSDADELRELIARAALVTSAAELFSS